MVVWSWHSLQTSTPPLRSLTWCRNGEDDAKFEGRRFWQVQFRQHCVALDAKWLWCKLSVAGKSFSMWSCKIVYKVVSQNIVLDGVSKWCWSSHSWERATLGGSDRYVEVSAAEQRSPPGFYPQMPQLTLLVIIIRIAIIRIVISKCLCHHQYHLYLLMLPFTLIVMIRTRIVDFTLATTKRETPNRSWYKMGS